MNKKIAATVLAFVFIVGFAGHSVFAQNESTAVWEKIYRSSTSDEQRYSVMLRIIELKDRAFVPLLKDALQNVYNSKIENRAFPDITKSRIALAKIIIQECGELRALESSDLIFEIYKNSSDALLRAEAAISLGKMRATDFVPVLSRDLMAINLNPRLADSRDQEILAFGLVRSLELMKSPLGYEAVFLASFGWYSGPSLVKSSAEAALQVIVEDPIDILIGIVSVSKDSTYRYAALLAAEKSKASPSRKVDLARATLKEMVQVHENKTLRQMDADKVRKKTLEIMRDNGDTTSQSVAIISQAILQELNDDEILLAYLVLGTNASAPAVDFLISRLAEYNQRQKTNLITTREKTIYRQILVAAGIAKSPRVRPVLMDGEFAGHDGQIIREIKELLKKLPQ